MIVFHEDMYLETDVTDYTLRVIQELYGPTVKDWLLLPGPVPLQPKLAAKELMRDANRLAVSSERVYR